MAAGIANQIARQVRRGSPVGSAADRSRRRDESGTLPRYRAAMQRHLPGRARSTCRRRLLVRGRTAASIATILLATGPLGLMACDRNIEPYRPGEEPRQPDLGRIFPGGARGLGGDEGGEEAGAAAESRTARSAFPPSRSEAGNAPTDTPAGSAGSGSGRPPTGTTAAESQPIRGRIELAPGMEGAQPADGVLFVIARPQGVSGGPPLAVLRIPAPRFPLEFTIGPKDVMIPSMRFAGSLSLSARLDADGNAMTRGEEDLSSAVEAPVLPGASGVRLLLSERG